MAMILVKRDNTIFEQVELREDTFTYTRAEPGRVTTVTEKYSFAGNSKTSLIREYRDLGYLTEAEVAQYAQQ